MNDEGRTNWLITGGCGFIGANLVQRLLAEKDHRIRVLDDLSTGRRSYLEELARDVSVRKEGEETTSFEELGQGQVELLLGDVREQKTVSDAARGTDVVVHLAASTGVPQSVEDPRRDCLTNVLGTLNCLEAARDAEVRRFVFASSAAPIGQCEPPIHEEMPARPASPYGASKLSGEGYCSAYYECFGLETTALRFGNVYGPYSSHKESVVAKFVRRGLSGQELHVHGDGEQTRDFIFTADLVDAIVRAAFEVEAAGELFQIATNVETTINQLAARVTEKLREAGVEPAGRTHTAPRQGDVRRNYADISKAEDLLGWRPRTKLAEGLAETITWFQSRE